MRKLQFQSLAIPARHTKCWAGSRNQPQDGGLVSGGDSRGQASAALSSCLELGPHRGDSPLSQPLLYTQPPPVHSGIPRLHDTGLAAAIAPSQCSAEPLPALCPLHSAQSMQITSPGLQHRQDGFLFAVCVGVPRALQHLKGQLPVKKTSQL